MEQIYIPLNSSITVNSGKNTTTNSEGECLVQKGKIFTYSIATPTSPSSYYTLAVLHITLILVPAIVLNTMALWLLSKTNKYRHPSTTVFRWMLAISMLGPSTYGLVMDISLFSDLPLLGRCSKRWEGIFYWLGHTIFHTYLLWLVGVLGIVIYLSIKSTKEKVMKWKLNIPLVILLIVCVFSSVGFVLLLESFHIRSCHIRGSFCVVYYSQQPAVAFLGIARVGVGFGLGATVVVISMVLYTRKIKREVNNRDKTLIQPLARLTIVLLLASFLITSPTSLLYLSSFRGTEQGYVEFLTTHTLQVNYLLFPVLIMILHKPIRRKIIDSMSKLRNMRSVRKIQPLQS